MRQSLAIAANLNPSIIALKPRQILLANANAIAHSTMSDSKSSSSLKADQKALLLSSLSQYLERNGFSKTVKKLRSEAQIEKDGLKDSPPNLEEIFKKYFETCNHATNANSQKEQVAQKDVISKIEEGVTAIYAEALSKKKKKKIKDNDDYAAIGQSKSADTKKSEETITSSTTSELNGKTKEKKKSKKISDSLDQGTEHVSSEAPEEPAQKDVGESQLEEPDKGDKKIRKKKSKVSPESLCGNGENHLELESKDVSKKSKDKKKKKDKLSSDSLIENSNEKDNIKSNVVDVATKETKASKKRKRLASEENDSRLADEKAIEESKLGKPGIDANTANENGQVGSDETGKTPMKQLKGCDNQNLDRSVEKSAKKQRIGSAEPTTLKAFQRVKVDEVVFTDERLQDNSYWAKDGAESGYGAKAQEVLGQVRGRDFRHEKTKKKRGSYRGGQIDLQSHSVKFNYSDEE